MKLLKFLFFLFFLLPRSSWAQGGSETIRFIIDKEAYQPFDTIKIRGLVICPETQQLSELSGYAYVELIDTCARVRRRQKVKCRKGLFSCRLPLDSAGNDELLFVRAYTRFMENFSHRSFPLRMIRKRQTSVYPVRIKEEETIFPLQLRYKEGVLVYRCMAENKRDYQLHVFTGKGPVRSYALSSEREGVIRVEEKSSLPVNCFVTETETDRIVFYQKMYPVLQKDSLTLFSHLPDEMPVASKTLTLALPPSSSGVYWLVYWERMHWKAANDRESRGRSDGISPVNSLPLRTGRAYRELLEGRYGYKVLPETVLTMEGNVSGKKKLPPGGMLTAFDARSGRMYACDLEPDGSYRMGVDDYPEGSEFFLQVADAAGKTYKYQIRPGAEPERPVCLPKWEWRAGLPSLADTVHSQWIPEIYIDRKRKQSLPDRSLGKSRRLTADDIADRLYTRLEDIYDDLAGVKLCYDEADGGFSRPFLSTRRGASTLSGGRLMVLLDGHKIDSEAEDIRYLIDVSELESVEYVPPAQANLYGAGSLDGVMVLKTKGPASLKEKADSQGLLYRPLGITPPLAEEEKDLLLIGGAEEPWAVSPTLSLPSESGTYRLVVKRFSEYAPLKSWSKIIRITKTGF